MNDRLVYPNERRLAAITLALGLLFWLILIVGTVGVALVALLGGFVAYLFAQSALIAWIRGNGAALDARQFPELHARFVACCETLQLTQRPQAFVLNGGGMINAFATRFLGHDYVVLLSETVDAMAAHPDGVAFYIGHELGHLKQGHLTKHLVRWPCLWLPLLGAAYSRAKESTCDRHGLACSSSPENAARALAALAVGGRQWASIDVEVFADQARASRGFWMSFHELCHGYPWLTKRVVRMLRGDAAVPARHAVAWLPAAFVPYAGRLGGGFAIIVWVYVIGVLAAVALPAYKAYVTKAQLAAALVDARPVTSSLASYYESRHQPPATLADVNAPEQLPDGTRFSLEAKSMALTVATAQGSLVLYPRVDRTGHIADWQCARVPPLRANAVPPQCRAEAGGEDE